MPYFNRQTIEGPHKSEVLLNGRFAPDTDTDPSTFIGAWIESVAHSATGKWTITIGEKFRKLGGYHSAEASLQNSTDDPQVSVAIGAIDLDAGTIVVLARREDDVTGISAAFDIVAAAGTFINVSLSVKYGGVPDGSGL